MAAELITPLDHLSGIPLPIMPQEFLASDEPEFANWHHPWHASSAPELQTLGGRALRHSRVQLVRASDHNQGDRTKGKLTYHDFYSGPPLPTGEDQQFAMCLLACAGHIPDEAIDLRGDEPVIVPLTMRQRDWLRTPAAPSSVQPSELTKLRGKAAKAYQQQTDPTMPQSEYLKQTIVNFKAQREVQAGFAMHHLVYRYQPLRAFFRDYVLSQDLSHIRESRVEEFLKTPDEARKLHLGRWLLAQAVLKTTDEVQRPYTTLRVAGKLHPLMPADANLLVLYKLGRHDDRTQLVQQYEERLKASLGLAAA